MRDAVRPFPLFQTSGQRRSPCSLCDDGGFITQINHFITADNSAETVGRRHDHREFARKAARSASSSFASVAMSSALVASSRINNDGRWERARARAMRWRCRPRAGYRTLQLFVLKPSAGIKTSSGGKCPGLELMTGTLRINFEILHNC